MGCGFDVGWRPRALTVSLCVMLQLDSLDLLTPSQAAEVTLTSGALNSTSQMDQVFDRLEKGDALKNVDEFFTALTEQEVSDMLTLSESVAQTSFAVGWHLWPDARHSLQVPFPPVALFLSRFPISSLLWEMWWWSEPLKSSALSFHSLKPLTGSSGLRSSWTLSFLVSLQRC